MADAYLNSYMKKWGDKIHDMGVGPFAAFMLRAHLPLTGVMAHAVMFGEPFMKMFNVDAKPVYQLLNDRDAVKEFIHSIENYEQ